MAGVLVCSDKKNFYLVLRRGFVDSKYQAKQYKPNGSATISLPQVVLPKNFVGTRFRVYIEEIDND